MMDSAVFRKTGVAAALLMLGLGVACARPPAPAPEPEREAPDQPVDVRQQGDEGVANDAVRPPHGKDANPRRKLSLDERRTLRRQINEAGQDIYRVKR